jgi:hypothetical protein
MAKYIIEGNIDFYDELYKSLGTKDCNNDCNDGKEKVELCQISGMPLVENNVILECNHKYNYDALYKEICKQKYIFRTYNLESLSKPDFQRFIDAAVDYYIRCPYCRHVQFTLLPYYENNGYEKRYGINSLVKEYYDNNYLIKTNMNSNYHYSAYGYTFLPGVCCKVVDVTDGQNVFCSTKYSAMVPMMNKSFCFNHIRAEVKQYNKEKKLLEKQNIKEQKLLDKQKEKEQKQKEKEQLKEKKTAEKKNTIIKQNIQIGEFSTTITDTNTNTNTDTNTHCCSILKSGAKKGQQCGAKGKYNGLCARHISNKKEEDKQMNTDI